MINASILTIGDEILIGQILNSNSKWLAENFTKIGCFIKRIDSISDSRPDIIKELDLLLQISDLIIITGGLGPTHDDITKDVLCEYFDDELTENKDWTDKLIKQFAYRGINFSERNKTQAFIPSKSILLWNDLGTAPGMLFNHKGKIIISLPGVPQEMVNIMENVGFKKINEIIESSSSDVIIYKNIQTNNIPESNLADLININSNILQKSTLAFLPSYRGVKLRIGAYGLNKQLAEIELKRLEDYIIPKISQYIVSYNETAFSKIIAELLTERNKSISVAESCTAGMLAAELTNIPGSSKYFKAGIIAYSNEIKINLLNINKDLIETYGAVSEQIAKEMSENIIKITNSDYAISITGIAGPDGGTEQKPVGTVWVGISSQFKTKCYKFNFRGNREMIRERAIQSAMIEFIKFLNN